MWETVFFKHELQMQLIAENMEGIKKMIAYILDTLEKGHIVIRTRK